MLAVPRVEESNVIVTVEEAAKLEPVTVTDEPAIPEAGVRVIDGTMTVRVAEPLCEPAPTEPVTVRVDVPPEVELEVAIVRGVAVKFGELVGKGIGLARVRLVPAGAPASESRIVLGRPVVVEPGVRETLTV